jgi:Fe-S cluster assembly protein SufB
MHWRLPVVCLVLQVPAADNYFTALNSAVFSDGSFVFVPKGVKSPMELSTYFRINASETGQVRPRAIPLIMGLHGLLVVGCCLLMPL